MAQMIAPNYGEQFLFPPALEDWVAADHPVRFLREFVEQLDLPALGFVVPSGSEGRPPYAPSLLLKIWLYGYFFRLRSTRRLEAACAEVLPLVWLCGRLNPDHNTLWRFWAENKKALRAVFQQSVQLAVGTGCVGLALQAVDGTKIEAAASTAAGWKKEYMEKLLAALEVALDQTELQVVAENAPTAAAVRLPAGLAARQALREQVKAGLAQLADDQRSHYHPVEPEARRMKVRQNNRYAYNAQAVADAQEGVIVACEVTRHENDGGQLVPMLEAAQANLGGAAASVLTLADTGYGAGTDLAAAAAQERPVLATPAEGTPAGDNPYATQHFVYDPSAHTVTCPRGHKLDHEGGTTKKELRVERFRCHCRDCPVRAQCTRDPKGRQIEVWPHTAVVQAMRTRLQEPAAQALLQQRATIIEPRFAQIKQHDGFRRWTVWGLESVRTQWALLCTTLNLRRLYRRWQARQHPPARPAALAWLAPASAGKKTRSLATVLLGKIRAGWRALDTALAARPFGSLSLSELCPMKYF